MMNLHVGQTRVMAFAVMVVLVAVEMPAQAQAQIGRLRRLPFCGIGPEAESPAPHPSWACIDSWGDGHLPTDFCSWSNGRPLGRPGDGFYKWGNQWDMIRDDLVWDDGTSLFEVLFSGCRNDWSSTTQDFSAETYVLGRLASSSGTQLRRVLGHIQGGFVEHVRPAYVEAQVSVYRRQFIALPWEVMNPNDLTLAIQVLGNNGWQDVVTRTFTSGPPPNFQAFSINGYVPELTDVRLEIRSRVSRQPFEEHAGYSVREGAMFVETCVPDAGNPGECLECSVGGSRTATASGWALIGLAILLNRRLSRRRRRQCSTASAGSVAA
jgi:hypothetical protein